MGRRGSAPDPAPQTPERLKRGAERQGRMGWEEAGGSCAGAVREGLSVVSAPSWSGIPF